jgi:high-affinity iron transporter
MRYPPFVIRRSIEIVGRCLRLSILIALIWSWCIPLGGTAPVALAEAPNTAPGLAAQAIRSDLFDAQAALLAGDSAAAAEAVAAATSSAALLTPSFGADGDVAHALEAGLAAASDAVARNDATALALAHGQVWSALVRGSYTRTLEAIRNGNAESAAAWLLVRDFRVTTRFDRPHGDATLAVQGMREGKIASGTAVETVRADLLDTYQARLESALNTLSGARPDALSSSEAEAVGLAVGYWPLLAPAFAEQLGDAARVEADATFATLVASAESDDAEAFAAARARAIEVVQSFRAAPLSETDQARRAGQLLRYLSLIPVEYGRGVKDGQVFLALEIEEAQAFLDGAQAAFADLRLPLRRFDPDQTASIETSLGRLDTALAAAASRQVVADPAVVAAEAEDASHRLTALVPATWLETGAILISISSPRCWTRWWRLSRPANISRPSQHASRPTPSSRPDRRNDCWRSRRPKRSGWNGSSGRATTPLPVCDGFCLIERA